MAIAYQAMVRSRTTRSERFLAAISAYDEIFVVTHDNPDPDAIATGWAIHCLIGAKLGKPVRLIGGGEIVRAENRHMIKLLGPPLELVREVTRPASAGVVLVDCGPTGQNHLFPAGSVEPVAVIDHHPPCAQARPLPFQDIRPRAVASASIAASYLREQEVEPSRKLATALLYALQTETTGNEFYYSRLDRTVFLWLSRFGDPSMLAEIENAPLSPAYFADLALALQGTFIYGDTALCLLPRASGPEIVGEVADLLIRGEGIRRVLCGAVVHDDIVLSVRTRPDGEDAAALVRNTLQGLGYGGGHRHRAGGKIPGRGRGAAVLEMLQDELLSRWLIACGIDRQRGHHLIARREIVENL
jgi:nanoRNase/pAp phosphatase (c-di-AMP/oligoRNAs hydrolase)